MKRHEAVKLAKRDLAAKIVEELSWQLDMKLATATITNAHVCIDKPQAVQILATLYHEECVKGEPIQLEFMITETIG